MDIKNFYESRNYRFIGVLIEVFYQQAASFIGIIKII